MLVLSYAIGLLPIDPERVVALRGHRATSSSSGRCAIGTTIHAEAEVAGTARRSTTATASSSSRWRVRDAGRASLVARATIDALWRRRAPAGRRRRAGQRRASAELSPLGGDADADLMLARRQAPADHRRDHPPQHRLRRRPRGPARRGRGRADRLRPRAAADRARRAAAARAARRARARRQQRGRPRGASRRSSSSRWGGSTASCTRSPTPPRTRSAAASSRPAARAPRRRSRPAPTRCRRWPRHLAPLLERADGGGAIVGLDFDASVAWPAYDWMGVAKAALESTVALPGPRPRAPRDPRQPRLRRARSRPRPRAASRASPSSPAPGSRRRRSAGTPTTRPRSPDAVCFLLSDWARAVSGEILHVDGGFHAVGPVPAAVAADAEPTLVEA